jgi:hypothetical protein
VAPGPRFGLHATTFERFLRLPYTLPAPQLIEAVSRLAAARRNVEHPGSRAWARPIVVA